MKKESKTKSEGQKREVVGVGDWGKNLMKKRNSKLKMENQKKGRKKRKIYNTSGDILIVKIFH